VNGHPEQTGISGGDPIAGLRAALRTSRPGADVELLQRAYDVAARWHQGQTRRSGDPYITHPVRVATILATLGADDQMLCAGILHDTLEYTPCTHAELRHHFGAGIATMVAEHTTLSHISRRQTRPVSQAMAAIRSTDARVVVMRMADRLHNMRTLQFLPQAKQLRKAREVLDIFVPAAQQLHIDTIGSELETLAFAALIRSRPAPAPCHRAIVALDIERSTSRPDPVKAEFRVMLYELFDAALRTADICRCHRDQFMDRGDGLLALIHRADRALEALLVNQVIPVFSRYLASYNASLPPQRQLRVRVVVHHGEVHYDANGCFGEALDVAFRLLDAPRVKMALKTASGPLLLVVSGDIYRSVIQHDHDGTGQAAFHRLLSADIAGKQHPGWIHIPRIPPNIAWPAPPERHSW
jgi:HD domain